MPLTSRDAAYQRTYWPGEWEFTGGKPDPGEDIFHCLRREAIEETGRAVAHNLEKYLSTLGTIATVAPLLGLLGTVIGMVELFGAFTSTGHDIAQFARGISVALYNTAAGIVVAVPAMIAYRYFRSKVDGLLVEMEQQAIKLVETIHGEPK